MRSNDALPIWAGYSNGATSSFCVGFGRLDLWIITDDIFHSSLQCPVSEYRELFTEGRDTLPNTEWAQILRADGGELNVSIYMYMSNSESRSKTLYHTCNSLIIRVLIQLSFGL